ncbi:MAG TPA: ubiquinol-cytochrome c reductase iron-sulfur subunit [Longimicrobiales bacterium]|nr:ubiquinol-cytochrome c reductase iron-sulfur subunit [Longimicrobiales bacterium]
MTPTPPTPVSSRRRFLDWLLGTAAGGLFLSVFYPAARYLVPPPSEEAATSAVTLAVDPNHVAPNSGQIFKFGREPGILIKTPSGELRAFTAICTHLACTVQYRNDLSEIWCACHNGHYDLNGVNISGPPPRPLERYALRLSSKQIQVSKRA